MKRKEIKQAKLRQRKHKLIIGSSILTIAILLSSTIAFADADISGLLTNWYNKKAETAKAVVEQSVNKELETQKVRIREELEAKMKASSEELDKYVNAEKESRTKAIRDYADKLINEAKFSNEEHEKEISGKLNEIESNAKGAMDEVINKYKLPEAAISQ